MAVLLRKLMHHSLYDQLQVCDRDHFCTLKVVQVHCFTHNLDEIQVKIESTMNMKTTTKVTLQNDQSRVLYFFFPLDLLLPSTPRLNVIFLVHSYYIIFLRIYFIFSSPIGYHKSFWNWNYLLSKVNHNLEKILQNSAQHEALNKILMTRIMFFALAMAMVSF